MANASTRAVLLPLWILAVVAGLFLLREARSLLIPIALAALISYALAPIVAWLERHGVSRLAGAGLVLILMLAACAGGAYAARGNASALMDAVPQALDRGRELIRTRLGPAGAALQDAAEGGGSAGQTSGGQASGGQVGQQAASQSPGGSGVLQRGVDLIFTLAGHAVVIFFLIYFLLIGGPAARNRLVELAGPDADGRRTASKILDDINTQIQRYLLVLLVTATIVAVSTWVVLTWMGVENALTWALLAGAFNSIPYFGPVIVSGGLFVVGLLQGGGVTAALQMSGAAIVITSLEGWLITPPLMGKAERMSALAVFLGLLLWTWLWGGWGTLLAVPMLVVVKAVADRVQTLKPLGRLLAP